MKSFKIFLGIPTLDGHIHAWLAMRCAEWAKKHDVTLYPIVGFQPVDRARNEMVDLFLKTDCTHIMMIDADTVPPYEAIETLISRDKDFISGLTPIIDGQNHRILRYNAVDSLDNEIKPDTGLHTSMGVGASCLLIKREVFQKIKSPWFRFLFADDTGKETFVSEDIFFISKCLQARIVPYVDSSVVCQHIKASIY